MKFQKKRKVLFCACTALLSGICAGSVFSATGIPAFAEVMTDSQGTGVPEERLKTETLTGEGVGSGDDSAVINGQDEILTYGDTSDIKSPDTQKGVEEMQEEDDGLSDDIYEGVITELTDNPGEQKDPGGVSSSGSVDASEATEAKQKNGFVKEGKDWIYYRNGNRSSASSDIVPGSVNGVEGWYYIENGKAVLDHSGVDSNINGWWYVKNGKVDFSYRGFAKNKHGWWYLEYGQVKFNKNDIMLATVNGEKAWWNVKGSKVVFDESVEGNQHGWWYVKNGKVDFSYNGFAKNKIGCWYIENGKVTFNKNDIILGTVGGEKAWWNVKGSKVIYDESIESNLYGWWYVKDGKVDFSYTGLAQNRFGWWYAENGKVNFNYTGEASNSWGTWRVENSKVNFKYNIATLDKGKWVGYVNGKKSPEAAVVSHASGDERGKFWSGQAGDQTGKEVYSRTWNDHPWEYVIRAKSPAMAEKIAYAMERAAVNDNIGYDMGQRNTLYHAASKVGWDPGKVTSKVECDCSSLVSVAAIYAGAPREILFQNGNCSYTANLRIRLKSTGLFEVYSSSDYTKSSDKLKRGDILIEEGEHTAVIVKGLDR